MTTDRICACSWKSLDAPHSDVGSAASGTPVQRATRSYRNGRTRMALRTTATLVMRSVGRACSKSGPTGRDGGSRCSSTSASTRWPSPSARSHRTHLHRARVRESKVAVAGNRWQAHARLLVPRRTARPGGRGPVRRPVLLMTAFDEPRHPRRPPGVPRGHPRRRHRADGHGHVFGSLSERSATATRG
jgi:hypothetical protein